MITSAELNSRMKRVSVVLTGGQIARASKVRWAPSVSEAAAALRGARWA